MAAAGRSGDPDNLVGDGLVPSRTARTDIAGSNHKGRPRDAARQARLRSIDLLFVEAIFGRHGDTYYHARCRNTRSMFGSPAYEYAQRLRDALGNDTQFAAYNKDIRHANVVVCLAFEQCREEDLTVVTQA